MARPEYVTCIAHPHVTKHRWEENPETKLREVVEHTHTICGRDTHMEFMFTGLDHAFSHSENDGRLLICPKCSKTAIKGIKKQTYNTNEK